MFINKFNDQTATDNNGHITSPINVIIMETISFNYKDPGKVFTSVMPRISYSISHLELALRGVDDFKTLLRVFYTTWTADKIAINKSLIKPANSTPTQGAKNNTFFQDAKNNMLSDPTESPPELKFISNAEVFVIVKKYDPKTMGETLSSSKVYKWREAMDAEISQLL